MKHPSTEPVLREDEPIEDGLGRRLHVLRLLITRTLEDGLARQAVPEITYQQLGVLNFLASRERSSAHRPILVGDVAAHLDASLPSASRLVSRLERAKLLQLEVSDGDKRRRCITLTAAGLAAVQEQEAPARELLRNMMIGRNEATVERWQDSLDELIEALLSTESGTQVPCLRCPGRTDGDCILRRLDRVDGLTCAGHR